MKVKQIVERSNRHQHNIHYKKLEPVIPPASGDRDAISCLGLFDPATASIPFLVLPDSIGAAKPYLWQFIDV
uniref:Uncharacterized protein n=1 Tax=Cucumis melo TaxID=3656 RepID=A0A9I9E625_CUCME